MPSKQERIPTVENNAQLVKKCSSGVHVLGIDEVQLLLGHVWQVN